jgi:FKBP-type peptidyl-prolyl cis-trans isomerase FkpA
MSGSCHCLVAALLFAMPASAQEPPVTPPPQAAPVEALLVTDLVTGIGDEALPGMIAIVHYTGWLHDPAAPGQRGRQFDSSRERGQPFSFPLGAGRVIRGWEQGVPGMRVGGRRLLVIPPSLAYGARNIGNGLIPPQSTLVFEVELLAVETVTLTPQAQ